MYNKHLTKKDKIALENNEFLKVRLPNHLKDQDNKGWWNLNRAYTLDAVGNCTFFCDEQKKLVLKYSRFFTKSLYRMKMKAFCPI